MMTRHGRRGFFISRRLGILSSAMVAAVALFASGALIFADHLSDGVNKIVITITNTTANELIDGQVPILLDSQSLINGLYMDIDGFNTALLDGPNHIGYMPGSGNSAIGHVAMLGCIADDDTDQTTECNDTTVGDITLPAANTEDYEFAVHNQASGVIINISTPAVADWSIVWEYWNGASYVALDNVTDSSEGFTLEGFRQISWDFPAAGAWGEETLHSISGYWVRARVDSAASVTTPPVATRSVYQIGRWWTVVDALGANEGKQITLHLDTEPGLSSSTFVTDGAASAIGSGGAYPPPYSGAALTSQGNCQTHRVFAAAVYSIRNCLLTYDTSSLPYPIEVTAAEVSCDVLGVIDDDARDVVFEWAAFNPTGSERHYRTIPQNNAHAGTALADINGATATFDLTNLYRILPNGKTSMRGHITGGEPTGTNFLALTGCELGITYSTEPQSHAFFPAFDGGYTLADESVLEPGDDFSLTVAGYFNLAPNGTGVMWGKENSHATFATHPTGADMVTFSANGGILLTASSVPSGYHVLEFQTSPAGEGNASGLSVDGVELDTGANVSISDSADNWIAGVHNAMPYMDYAVLEVGQEDVVIHQLRELPRFTMPDWAVVGSVARDAQMHFPETGTGSAYSVSLGAVAPSVASEGAGGVAGPDVIGENPAIGGFSDPASSSEGGFVLFDLFFDAADESGYPYQAIVSVFAIAIISALMVATAVAFKEGLIVGIVGEIGLIIAWQMGALPGWMPILFAFPMILFLVWKRATP